MIDLTVLQAIILGVIQGFTEFLPVSSSAHLAIARNYLNVETHLTFDILLHIATLLAVLMVIDKKIIFLAKNWRENTTLLKIIAGATAITAIFGFLMENKVNLAFSNLPLVGILLLVNSLILAINHPKFPRFKLDKPKFVWLGLAQSLALFPGISRSGSTITCAKLMKFKPKEAFEASFLLYIPAVLGALIFEIIKEPITLNQVNILPISFGFLTAFLSGLAALSLIRKTIEKGKFWVFAPYCIVLGLLLIFF